MSENGENPELDPTWERTRLLDTLQDMYKKRIGAAALHMTEKLTAVVV